MIGELELSFDSLPFWYAFAQATANSLKSLYGKSFSEIRNDIEKGAPAKPLAKDCKSGCTTSGYLDS